MQSHPVLRKYKVTGSVLEMSRPCCVLMHSKIWKYSQITGKACGKGLQNLEMRHAEGVCPAGGFKAKFHVGDTPMDVLAADDGDATAVGVLTGIYTQDELEKTGVGEQGLPPICCSWPGTRAHASWT